MQAVITSLLLLLLQKKNTKRREKQREKGKSEEWMGMKERTAKRRGRSHGARKRRCYDNSERLGGHCEGLSSRAL